MQSAILIALVALSATLVAADGDWPGFPRKQSLQKRDSSANIDDWADEIIDNVKEYMVKNDLDPTPLSDRWVYNITHKVFLITYKFQLGLYDCEARNLTTIHRINNAVLSYTSGDLSLHLNITVEFDPMVIYCKYVDKLLIIGPEGSVTATLKQLSAKMDVSVGLLSGKATLEDFQLDTAKNIKIDVTGLFIFNWVVEFIANFFTWFLKNVILGIVENRVENTMKEVVASARPLNISSFF